MRRLIDANALMDSIIDQLEIEWGYEGIREDVKRIFENAPTVDAVEVVRCKDCRHWTMGYCNHFAYYDYEPMTNEDDYCSYGERREGE